MSWQNVLKLKPTKHFRGDPKDPANRGGRMDVEQDEEGKYIHSIQENPETMNYRQHFGPMFGAINRMVPKHEKYAMRDKKHSEKHQKWAQTLRNYESEVKQMIVDYDSKGKHLKGV